VVLPQTRILREGKTHYAWEREAIEFVKQCLPNREPYHLLALFEVPDGSTSRLYEIDLLVIGYSAIYLIECKGHPGLIEGDARDWYWTPGTGEKKRYFGEPPLRLTNHKAKVIKSLLDRRIPNCPRVEALVFLSAPGVQLNMRDGGEMGVVTRETIERAITRGEYPGSYLGQKPFGERPQIRADALRGLLQMFRNDAAFRESKARLVVGQFVLGDIVREGVGFQERRAVHQQNDRFERTARIYVRADGGPDQGDQLRHAAEREMQILWDLHEHDGILRAVDYDPHGPLGPTILFDAFEDGEPLDAFLRRHPELPLQERVQLVERIGRALAFCHRKSVVHGALGPHSVLVRRDPETGKLETKLVHFHLGASTETSGTHHWTQLASPEWNIYQAPELRESATRTTLVDLFGLGATAYFILTGEAPAASGLDAHIRLSRERAFDPRSVRDDLGGLAQLVMSATAVSGTERDDDAFAWTELFIEAARALEPPNAATRVVEIDPLEARKDSELGPYLVTKVLGQGATARVFEVEDLAKDELFALKVALDPRHHQRLLEEADELDRLRHPRIVAVHDRAILGGRQTLLLSHAGQDTLQRYLEHEGVPSLEFAVGFGEDLLSALEALEDQAVIHRDIKPANLGIGIPRKKERRSLTLFDFSLARAPLNDINVGTSAYRDPYLPLRRVNDPERRDPEWDAEADRWSAAVTLHEMLTGTRPHFAGRTAVDPDARIVLAAERFDASVREGLVAFFEKAFAREVKDRFETAERMRKAWLGAIDEKLFAGRNAAGNITRVKSLADGPLEAPRARELTDAELAAFDLSTPIAALPLSTRARNSLDRAGLERIGQLRELPDNRLSALRGAGRGVQTEIHDFRRRWVAAREQAGLSTEPPQREPFFPGYKGPDLDVSTTNLGALLIGALRLAGISTLSPLASVPRLHIEHIVQRALTESASLTPERLQQEVNALRSLLHAENRSQDENNHPDSLEAWIHALFGTGKTHQHARALFGLEGPLEGRISGTVRALATARDVTPPAIYIALGKSREKWRAHPTQRELVARIRMLLDTQGGVARLDRLAQTLLDELPHDATGALLVTKAAALVRVAIEVDEGITLFRLGTAPDGGAHVWVCLGDGFEAPLAALGAAVDALVSQRPLPGPAEAARGLRTELESIKTETTLEASDALSRLLAVRDARLLSLASDASAQGALSTRLELYPRALSAKEALEYASSMLQGGFTPTQVQALVSQRYPEAAPLPERPQLDELLKALGLDWSEAKGAYQRRQRGPENSSHTRHWSSQFSHHPANAPTWASSQEIREVDLDESVRLAIELRTFRVLGIKQDRIPETLRRFIAAYGARPVRLDQLLATAMLDEAKRLRMKDLSLLHRTDLAALDAPNDWKRLVMLAKAAAASLSERVFTPPPGVSPDAPIILLHPGLLARYELTEATEKLFEQARSTSTPATFLACPMSDVSHALPTLGPIMRPRETHAPSALVSPLMPIPGLLAAQLISVPRAWVTVGTQRASA
jgi:serine/threonine protein kinase